MGQTPTGGPTPGGTIVQVPGGNISGSRKSQGPQNTVAGAGSNLSEWAVIIGMPCQRQYPKFQLVTLVPAIGNQAESLCKAGR